jgi:hypothetical protein
MRTVLLALLVVLVAGCPKPRTAAATQPSPAAFDPARSDAKAIEIVDAGLAALGGHDKWDAVKELTFDVTYSFKGEVKSRTSHGWDRWNGRHSYQEVDMSTVTGKPDDLKVAEVRYDLFDAGRKPFATYDGHELTRPEGAAAAERARKHLIEEGYYLTLVHKLRDPGVHLAVATEAEMPTTCDPGCTSVKLTFDPTVGKDTWFVAYNTTSKLPEVIAVERQKGQIIGYKIAGWTEAGGLKFPSKLINVALDTEIWEFGDVKVGEPDDNNYMRNVNE